MQRVNSEFYNLAFWVAIWNVSYKLTATKTIIFNSNYGSDIFYLFLPNHLQVYLLGYGAKLFRFNFGSSNSQGDASQESDVSSAESITGQKRNYLLSE